MQTFLAYPDFLESAKVLDKKRCWKQVIEASQIIDVLEGRKTGWANHPAVKMWVGHTDALKIYFNVFLQVCKDVHNINTRYREFEIPDNVTYTLPWWVGNDKFHRSMRSRLIEKDPDFYGPKFPRDIGYNGGKYWWPNMDGSKTFKII